MPARCRLLHHVLRAHRDRVDCDARLLGQVHQIVIRHQAGRVITVREDDQRLTTNVIIGPALFHHLFQREIGTVIQRRAAFRGRRKDRLFRRLQITTERVHDLRGVLDIDDEGAIAGAQRVEEADGRLLHQLHLAGHAR